jgi:hypothetical protein
MVALGCLGAVGGLLLAATPRPTDPDPRSDGRPHSLVEQVQRGEEVILIGPNGLPPSRLVITDGNGALSVDGDGFANLHGPNYMAVELSDEALPPRFELSAEVSPELGGSASAQFGVYAGRRRWPSSDGQVDRMVYAGVSNQLNKAVRGKLGIVWLEPGRAANSPTVALGPPMPVPPPKNDLVQREWYVVALRIAPDRPPEAVCQGVAFKVEAKPNKSPPIWTQILSSRRHASPRADDPPLLGAGVGVYILNGTARFRNVRMKPY